MIVDDEELILEGLAIILSAEPDLVVTGTARDGEQALARMRTALSETVIEGINTNVPLHRELMVDAKFMAGGTNIHYLEEWLSQHKR